MSEGWGPIYRKLMICPDICGLSDQFDLDLIGAGSRDLDRRHEIDLDLEMTGQNFWEGPFSRYRCPEKKSEKKVLM